MAQSKQEKQNLDTKEKELKKKITSVNQDYRDLLQRKETIEKELKAVLEAEIKVERETHFLLYKNTLWLTTIFYSLFLKRVEKI